MHPPNALTGRGPVGTGGWGGSSGGGGRNLPNLPPPPFGWSWLSVLFAAAGTVTVALIGLSQFDYFVVSRVDSERAVQSKVLYKFDLHYYRLTY